MLFKTDAERNFHVRDVTPAELEALAAMCGHVYEGHPAWANPDERVRSVNFAKTICSEVARLTTLGIGITIDGSSRAAWMQEQINKTYYQIRQWVEYGCAYGTVIIKPNGEGFDVFTPDKFMVTDCDAGGLYGVVFFDTYAENKKYYTRLEYHRFVDARDGTPAPYYISNLAYVSDSSVSLGEQIPLNDTHWAGLMDDTPPILKTDGSKLDGPLFGVLKMPTANNLDTRSPLGLPIFAQALEELRDFDVAYSRQAKEVYDSSKIMLVDDRLIDSVGKGEKNDKPKMGGRVLPDFVYAASGTMANEFYQEINPTLQTEARISGKNDLLSQIGYKCGFSDGYFVPNGKSGVATATQVEADDRRTIQLIKDVRDQLESCLNGAIYALSVYADLYAMSPVGVYEVTYDFGDITYNREEDRMRWWQYVTTGKVPAWMYFVKFEGMSEEEAKAMEAEVAQTQMSQGLFGEE